MNTTTHLNDKIHLVFRGTLTTFLLLMVCLTSFQTFATNQAEAPRVSPIKRAAPVYPKYALKRGIEGAVLVNFSIEIDGGVSDIEVVASDQDGLFDASTILGVQKWLYTNPAQKMRNNYIAIEFALSEKPEATQYSNVEKIQIRGE